MSARGRHADVVAGDQVQWLGLGSGQAVIERVLPRSNLLRRSDAHRSKALAANLDILRKNGMQVTQFPPAEVAKLREKMKPVVAQFTTNVGEATVNEVMAELAKMRK